MDEALKEAARQVGLAILATVQASLGSLDKVKRLLKTFGMVNCTDDFLDQPKVINGFSELMKDVFGTFREVAPAEWGGGPFLIYARAQ